MPKTIGDILITSNTTYIAAVRHRHDFVMIGIKQELLDHDESELRDRLAQISPETITDNTKEIRENIALALERIGVIKEIHTRNISDRDCGYTSEGGVNSRGRRIHEVLRLVKARGSDIDVELLKKLQEDALSLENEKKWLEGLSNDPERLKIVENQLEKLREIARIVTEDQVDDSGSDVEDQRLAQAAE